MAAGFGLWIIDKLRNIYSFIVRWQCRKNKGLLTNMIGGLYE